MRILILLIVLLSLVVTSQAQQQKFQVRFEGNRIFSSETLLEKLNFCLAKSPDNKDEFDAVRLEYCLQTEVRCLLESQGHIRAVVGKPRIQGDAKSLTVFVPIEEGMVYRLGSVNIQGAKLFDSERLRKMLDLKTGNIADGGKLREWFSESMRKLYEDTGYIQSDFDPAYKYKHTAENANEGIVDVEVFIDEGRRFTIRRIEFAGNERTPDQILRTALLVKENEPFSQRRFDESIEKLNDLGLFERIDKDRDVNFWADEESSVLKINIRVKEKKLF